MVNRDEYKRSQDAYFADSIGTSTTWFSIARSERVSVWRYNLRLQTPSNNTQLVTVRDRRQPMNWMRSRYSRNGAFDVATNVCRSRSTCTRDRRVPSGNFRLIQTLRPGVSSTIARLSADWVHEQCLA